MTEVVMHTECSLSIGNVEQCIHQSVSNCIELSDEQYQIPATVICKTFSKGGPLLFHISSPIYQMAHKNVPNFGAELNYKT